MNNQYDVTAMGKSPLEDRAHRMKVYFIAMSVRVACVASLVFVRGWWLILVGVAAVVLPYFAVLIANQAAHDGGGSPEQPTPLELQATQSGGSSQSAADAIIVIDEPAERRSASSPASQAETRMHIVEPEPHVSTPLEPEQLEKHRGEGS